MAFYPSFNLVESIVDEVALEGLDGITLQALWIRLANRFHDSLPLPKPFMEQVWSICKKLKEFSFYELITPREPLVIFDRYEYVHPDLGIIFEPPNLPSDIYPHCPIKDSKTGVKGSCSSYYTRKNINNCVKNTSLDEITEKYGLSLVIVASQQVRTRALMDSNVSPTLELTIMHYCFLERVGRSRYHGEVTQGKLSLAVLNGDPKGLFYHRKFLLHHKLITKQVHHQKSAGHCGNGSLLHLPRFYVERKPKVTYLAEQVLKILRSKKDGIAEYDEIKKELGIENSIKKLFKTSFFQKIVRTDLCVPYRTLYPNAEPSEWRQKQDPSKEKKIRVVQLLYPDADIADLWNKEEKDDDEDVIELDVSNHKFKVPYLKQANAIVEASKLDGLAQVDLGKQMGLTKLQARAFLRNLVKVGIIATYMNDIGRQRITRYVSKKYEERSKMSKQFNKEMYKIKELTKRITSEKEENEANSQQKNNIAHVKQDDQKSHSDDDKSLINIDASVADKDTRENYVRNNAELKNKFYAVNSILRRYRLLKFRSKYKCTTSKSLNALKTATKEEKLGVSSVSMQKIANNAKATSLYNSIKTNLIMQKPVRTGNGVNEVFGFMEVVQNSEKKNISNITYRLLRRANMIIEAVKEHQVIDDMTKLMKMICEEEDKEGYVVKIDKKSLIRLLLKLAMDNLVKNIKLTLSANGREKNLTFICDPNIDMDHTVIKSAVEQAKLKFCLMGSQKPKMSAKKTEQGSLNKQDKADKSDSKEQLHDLNITSATVNFEYDPTAGKRYGLSPKFIKMKTIHVLLFYLVYGHVGVPKKSQQEQVMTLRSNGYDIDDNLVQEFSTIYNTEVSWKMFIPPLPKHISWPKGWALMCDVLMSLPLSIFVKVYNIKYVIPDFDHYLSHPIRKHYLVKNLPDDIRGALLHGRKYIFNIHSIVSKLGYIGLVQFGPQRLKDKDQVFIYVNQRTELMDTVSSAPSYHNIEDKEYPVIKYFFDNIHTVEKYWYDMWNICVNTPLGSRLVVHGKDIVVEDLDKKNILVEAIVARNSKEAASMDTGVVPGDRKGAAGIDSAFFAHLKRNWNWATNYSMYQTKTSRNSRASKKREKFGQRDLHLSKIQIKPVRYTEYVGLKKVSGPPAPTISGTELRKQVYDYISKPTDIGRKNEVLLSHQNSRQKSVVRRVMPRKRSSRPRLKYDEDDYQAMQMMSKLRTDWESHEVNILLVCKIAMTYLSPNPRKQVVNFMAVRDVLRTYSCTSYNKTSRACQRRLMYMLRQQCTINSLALGVEEIKQDPLIDERYNGIMDRLKSECSSTAEYEKQVTEVFKDLVDFIMKKYYDITDIKPNKHIAMPKTAHEFNLLFKIIYPAKPYHNQGFRKDVRNMNDIYSATIHSIIHSSMYCAKLKRSWAYEIFKIYQHYSEALLRPVIIKIRTDQMVTVRKNHLSTLKKGGNYVPMGSAQYKFSANYEYKFQTKWNDVFKGTFDTFSELLQHYMEQKNVTVAEQKDAFIEIQPIFSGIVMAMHDLLACNHIDFDIEMPEQIIILDSRYQDKDETYFRVAQRYQDILTRLYRFKFGNAAAQNARFLELDETETNEKLENPATRKRPADKNDDLEESNSKIRCKNEYYDVKEQMKKSPENQQDEVATEKKSTDRGVEFEELTSNSHSSVHESTEENCAEHSSRKRIIEAEEDSVDCEEPFLKRPRLYSDDSIDLLGAEELEETNLYEDLKNIEKMKRSKSLQMKILAEEQSKKQASLNQLSSSTDLTAIPRRVNEIIKKMPLETNYLSSYCKIDDTNDIQKKYTRIAMLRMREELDDLTVADSHHAHEYFVVNAFKMFYRLDPSPLETTLVPSDQIGNDKNYSVPNQLVPLKMEVINKMLNEVNQFAIFPKNVLSYKDYKNDIITKKKEIAVDWKHVDAVYKFVREKKELGACPQELMDEFFQEQSTNLYTIVSLLIENRIFLRSGVTCPRYIHHHHVNPWLTHSCKIYRLEQEVMGPFKDSIYATMPQGKIVNTDVKTDTKHNEKDTDKKLKTICATPSTSLLDNQEIEEKVKQDGEKIDGDSNNQENKKEDNETNEECDILTRKRTQRQRTCSSSQKDKSMQLPDLPAEEIKVVMKPWIRIDGVLNRKVLDKMLGAVLSYSLLHPGLTMTKIQNRFIPALQPFNTRELVEMLVKLGCLKCKLLKKTRVTLFSQPSAFKISDITADASCWAAEDEIVLEPAIDAILKFGVFLSRTMYSTDFV